MFWFWYLLFVIITIGLFYLMSKIMVHSYHSWSNKSNKPLKFTRWQWLLILIVAFCPIVNFMSFLFMVPIWFENELSPEFKEDFSKSKFKKFLNYLNEEV